MLAVEAGAAVRIPRADDVVTWFDQSNFAPHRLHHTRPFVTQHDGQGIGQRSFDHLEIGVAQTAGVDAHQHVSGVQVTHLDGLDAQRTTDPVQ